MVKAYIYVPSYTSHLAESHMTGRVSYHGQSLILLYWVGKGDLHVLVSGGVTVGSKGQAFQMWRQVTVRVYVFTRPGSEFGQKGTE